MKSAGKASRNASSPWCGKPHCANGMQPESNQQSITSGTRRIVAPQPAQGKVTLSTHGLWTTRCSGRFGSFAQAAAQSERHAGLRSSARSSLSSASSAPQASHCQIGSGVPHHRSRDSAQSTLLARKSPKRPSLMCSGSQKTCWLLAIASSIRSVVRMNQAGRANWISGSSEARQQKGYSWRTVPSLKTRPRARRWRTMSRSASLQKRPAKSVTASGKRPSVPSSWRNPIPCSRQIRKSSSPKAGAVWTIPVPVSEPTKSAGMICQARPPSGVA